MSAWSTVRNALPSGMQMTYCYECGFSSFVPYRDTATAAGAAPLSSAAAPPTCPRCGSTFVQRTSDPSQFGDLYGQAVARSDPRSPFSSLASSAAAQPAPSANASPTSGPGLWSVLRSVFGTIQNSTPTIQDELREALSGVWSGQWEVIGANNATVPDLPPECQQFTVDDVLSTFEQFPNGLPSSPATATTSGTAADAASRNLCPICLEDCAAAASSPGSGSPSTSYVVRLHCHHCFHRACLRQWITARHFSCPLCRQPMIYK